MKTSRIDNRCGQEYVTSFRVFVQASGDICVVMANQRMEVSPDELHALTCGMVDMARIFGALAVKVDTDTLAVLGMNGNSTM